MQLIRPESVLRKIKEADDSDYAEFMEVEDLKELIEKLYLFLDMVPNRKENSYYLHIENPERNVEVRLSGHTARRRCFKMHRGFVRVSFCLDKDNLYFDIDAVGDNIYNEIIFHPQQFYEPEEKFRTIKTILSVIKRAAETGRIDLVTDRKIGTLNAIQTQFDEMSKRSIEGQGDVSDALLRKYSYRPCHILEKINLTDMIHRARRVKDASLSGEEMEDIGLAHRQASAIFDILGVGDIDTMESSNKLLQLMRHKIRGGDVASFKGKYVSLKKTYDKIAGSYGGNLRMLSELRPAIDKYAPKLEEFSCAHILLDAMKDFLLSQGESIRDSRVMSSRRARRVKDSLIDKRDELVGVVTALDELMDKVDGIEQEFVDNGDSEAKRVTRHISETISVCYIEVLSTLEDAGLM